MMTPFQDVGAESQVLIERDNIGCGRHRIPHGGKKDPSRTCGEHPGARENAIDIRRGLVVHGQVPDMTAWIWGP